MSKRSMKNYSKDQVQLLPFTLIPSSFPEEPFFTVKNVQVFLNELIHKVAYDKEFLTNSLKRYCEFIYHSLFFYRNIALYICFSTIEADPFTAKLFHIYEIVYKEGFSQVYKVKFCKKRLSGTKKQKNIKYILFL